MCDNIPSVNDLFSMVIRKLTILQSKSWCGSETHLHNVILLGGSKTMHIKPFGELPFSFEAQVGGQNKSNYRLRVMYVLGWIEMKMQNCSIVAIQVSLYLQLLGSFLLLKLWFHMKNIRKTEIDLK